MMWDCNSTALHMTTESDAIDIARMLLDAGADPNVRDDKFNATALGWAEFFGRADLAELIRAKGGVAWTRSPAGFRQGYNINVLNIEQTNLTFYVFCYIR